MTPDPLGPVRGTLDLLVLKTLDKAPVELHGFAILEWIKESTGEQIIVEDGALYHALHRMEERGWVESDWGVSEKGRRARYYRLTARGQKERAAAEERWQRYVTAVARISDPAGG